MRLGIANNGKTNRTLAPNPTFLASAHPSKLEFDALKSAHVIGSLGTSLS